jgi:hypothetical protein
MIIFHQFTPGGHIDPDALTERCTAAHPDHELFQPPTNGEPRFWTVWCSICDAKGFNSNGRHNLPSLEMSDAYLVEAKEWAANYTPPSRRHRERCKCPTCGKLH